MCLKKTFGSVCSNSSSSEELRALAQQQQPPLCWYVLSSQLWFCSRLLWHLALAAGQLLTSPSAPALEPLRRKNPVAFPFPEPGGQQVLNGLLWK